MSAGHAVFLAAVLCASPMDAARLNAPAPGFNLASAQNTHRSLAAYKGKIVLINFWASWCAPCQQELPELNRLAMDYKSRNLRVLAINVDNDRNAARQALRRMGLSSRHFEILWDSRSEAVKAYNVPTMPTSYIIDRNGFIRSIHSGFRPGDPAAWRREIDALLKN